MNRWHIAKWIQRHRWFFPSLLGGMALVSVLLLGQDSLFTYSGSAPAPSPAPIASPSITANPSPAPELAPSQKQSRKGETPPQEPALTPEQEAAQQEAIKEFQSSIPTADSLIEMRVAIAIDATAVEVGVSGEASLLNKDGEQIDTLTPGQFYTAQPSGSSVVFNGTALDTMVWIEPPLDGLLYVGDQAYRGRLLLAVERGSLWAVNFVSMRNYLYSVVPSEVSPSWDVEALKAQAVAARSYALTYYFEPINPLYHLGDDQYFQVYSGVTTEDDRTRQAIDATAGEYVSYRGGVVESLYAASDDIVAEAFQGQGMSQLGALDLAEQGYTYDKILANYYPRTSIARIAQDF